MFWRFGGYANISTIDSLLDKPDVTVEELLDESDLIQELKAQNGKLLEFLRDDNILDRLLQFVLQTQPALDGPSPVQEEPAQDTEESSSTSPLSLFKSRQARSKSIKDEEDAEKDEKQRAKHAYVACEILSSDAWSIAEALMENKDGLRRFWGYLKTEAPLDGVEASYFTKVNESLLEKKTEEMIEFIKSLDGILADMLKHVDCPVIMDLLLKIISLERSEGGQGIIDWLQSQNLIHLLLANLSADNDAATQTSAGDFLKAIITISANATAQDSNVVGPNELTRQLVSEECVTALIKEMLRGGNPLTVGVGIIIEVIRKNNSDYDLDNQISAIPKSSDPIYLGTLLRKFAEHIPDFMNLITSGQPARKELKVAFGTRIEPLGFDRFKTCELMAELLHCSNMILLNQPGSEAEVKARDAERSRLKAEGKLTPAYEGGPEFGTSVDSSGFHHARAPSFGEEGQKKLEVSNNTEEDFEDVASSDALADEVKDDFDEKDQEDKKQIHSTTEKTPTKDSEKQPLAEDADELEKQIESLVVSSDDKAQLEVPEVPRAPPAEAGREISPHPEDKPAPLFFGKARSAEAEAEAAEDAAKKDDTPAPEVDDSPQFPFQADLDGKPVVGDALKIKFVEHQVVPTILNFFFRFPWNNFLHNVVYDVVQQVFNGQMERGYNRCLAIDLFETGTITERIIEGQAASDKSHAESNMRLGYMGHLTLIAEEVVKFTERIPPESLSQLVLDKVISQEWIYYVENTLAETRERDNAILGGVRPDASLGPRQAVLNAVNAAQGFGGIGNSLAALSGGAPSDTIESAQSDDNGSGTNTGYLFSGSSLMSGFSHGSSDEEDEEGEEESDRRASFLDESEQVGEVSFDEVDLSY